MTVTAVPGARFLRGTRAGFGSIQTLVLSMIRPGTQVACAWIAAGSVITNARAKRSLAVTAVPPKHCRPVQQKPRRHRAADRPGAASRSWWRLAAATEGVIGAEEPLQECPGGAPRGGIGSAGTAGAGPGRVLNFRSVPVSSCSRPGAAGSGARRPGAVRCQGRCRPDGPRSADDIEFASHAPRADPVSRPHPWGSRACRSNSGSSGTSQS